MDFQITKYVKSRTDEELLNDMKKVADANGRKLTQKIYRAYRKNIDSTIAYDTTISKQIGWSKALSLIDVKFSQPQNNSRISEEELLEEILRLWTELGRQPTTTDLKNRLSKYPRSRFNDRFGGWGNALKRFVEWVNNEDYALTTQILKEQDLNHKTNRDINLRQRFVVMQRDNFKCSICGNTPASNPEVRLHVDHIIPWSKDGETVMKNLQTLCQNCNLGKSDLDM